MILDSLKVDATNLRKQSYLWVGSTRWRFLSLSVGKSEISSGNFEPCHGNQNVLRRCVVGTAYEGSSGGPRKRGSS